MMSELGQIKYKMFIKDINAKIERNTTGRASIAAVSWQRYGEQIMESVLSAVVPERRVNGDATCNTGLLIIYDYDKLNELAKIIVSNSKLFISGIEDEYKNLWSEKYSDKSQFEEIKDRIIAAKYLVKMCLMGQNRDAAYKFIFWSLMILTVDKTDVEEHLSLICDFAKMLNISEEEVEDIVYLIKFVYDATETEYIFKSATIPRAFANLLQ